MYSNKLAIAIKSNGKVLREFGESVYVPFGTEYKILVKNLNIVRAVVNITIDGNSASGGGIVVEAGKEVELERFLKTDLLKGNKFKFIERTSSIEKHRGVGIEDGLINVSFQFEAPYISQVLLCDYSYPLRNQQSLAYPVISSTNTSTNSVVLNSNSSNENLRSKSILNTNLQNEAGITVPGSISEQKFTQTYVGTLESIKHNMVIKLVGETEDNQPVVKPITVDIKPVCVTCGRKNKATNQFCGSCGTSLQIAC